MPFTVDEETGLTGAFELDKNLLKGRILLNLDSEDEGELFIGCAGGKGTTAKLFFQKEKAPANHLRYHVKVSGLKGGHSGDDIHHGLGNANKILNRLLWMATRILTCGSTIWKGQPAQCHSTRKARAICCIPANLQNAFEQAVESLASQLKASSN